MRKALLWIMGILAVLILAGVGVWGYLFLYGAPKGLPVQFASAPSLPEGVDTTTPSVSTGELAETPDVVSLGRSLSQITTRAVAGATVSSRDGAHIVRYVERGTGHVYELSVESGQEQRISNTTFPASREVVWAPGGGRVAIRSMQDGVDRFFVGAFGKGDSGAPTLSGENLPATARNVAFSSIGDIVYYTIATTEGTEGYERDLKTGKDAKVFSTPLLSIRVLWGTSPLLYTKPNAGIVGYAYDAKTSARTVSGPALMVGRYPVGTLTTTSSGNGFVSTFATGTSTVTIDKVAIPEKCGGYGVLICAVPSEQLDPSGFPDMWYSGAVILSDNIWKFSPETGVGTRIAIPEELSGRVVDVDGMAVSDDDLYAVFINKTDATLWLLPL